MAINKIQATTVINKIMDEFYDDLRERADTVAWCMGPAPYEVMNVHGISCFLAENTAARIASAQLQDIYMDYSKAAGLGVECCSYAKINIGQALMMVDGVDIPERFQVPKPDFLVLGNACPSMMQWSYCLGKIFNVPVFVLDMPFLYESDPQQLRDNAHYTRDQIKEFIEFLEEITGRPFDYDRLKENIHEIREMGIWRKLILETVKAVPAPASFIDGAVAMVPSLTMRNKSAAEMYKAFAEEVIDRASKGIGVSDNEKYRLMWRGNFPWYAVGKLARIFNENGAVLVNGTYGFGRDSEYIEDAYPPDGLHPDDPLFSEGCEFSNSGYSINFETKFRTQVRKYIEGFQIDAVIIHSPHTCRPWGMGSYDMCAMVEKEYGIPAIVLELDHTDQSYFNEAQVRTRLQALFESIDDRRAKAKEAKK